MQKIIILLFFIFSNVSFSQEILDALDGKNTDSTTIIVYIDPQFSGGDAGLNNYIKNNYRAIRKEPSGEIIVMCVVEKDGCISDIKIVSNKAGINSGKELIHVLQNSPKWIPAIYNGKRVKGSVSFPVLVKNEK